MTEPQQTLCEVKRVRWRSCGERADSGCLRLGRHWLQTGRGDLFGRKGSETGWWQWLHNSINLLKIIELYAYNGFIFRERGKEEERERPIDCERYTNLLPIEYPQLGSPTCNPGMCPDWELNQQPVSSQAGPQSNDPHQLGHKSLLTHSITFSIQCTNLFLHFSCVFTFLEIIKHNMPKMLHIFFHLQY